MWIVFHFSHSCISKFFENLLFKYTYSVYGVISRTIGVETARVDALCVEYNHLDMTDQQNVHQQMTSTMLSVPRTVPAHTNLAQTAAHAHNSPARSKKIK